MPRKDRLKTGIRGALNSFLAPGFFETVVGQIELAPIIRVHSSSVRTRIKLSTIDPGFTLRTRNLDAGFSTLKLRSINKINTEVRRLRAAEREPVVNRVGPRVRKPEVREVNPAGPKPRTEKINVIGKKPEIGKLPVKIRNETRVRELSAKMSPVVRSDIEFDIRPRIMEDYSLVHKYPVSIQPTSWGHMERAMILACWELIRGTAIEEVGKDPGRDLEMLAIYPNLDLRQYRSLGYNPKSRGLVLFPSRSDGAYKIPEGENYSHCAIIIGVVRDTGRYLKAIFPTGEYNF
jgi:hypothetical protein